MRIDGARVLITGGAGGIGSASALELAGLGARVMVADIDGAALDRLGKKAAFCGADLRFKEFDVSREEEVISLVEDCKRDLGGLDVLVCAAGIVDHCALVRKGENGLEKLPLNRWQRVIDVNLTGAFLCAREAAGLMIGQGRPGVIINISSFWRTGRACQSAYSASKAGMAALTRVWADELARHGIRSVGIAPGYIDTPMTELIPEPTRQNIARLEIPLGRFGRPEEVALLIRHVIENDYLTGRVFDLDGGARP